MHPFAAYIRLLGRGKTLSRGLTAEEAEQAMAMILAGEARPEQIGAFLMLLRMKEESAAEIAGFVRAARARLPAPPEPRPDLDWPAYAGKARRPPWHLLAALRLAGAGYRVALHGLDGSTPGRLYAGETLTRLGLPPARDFAEAAAQLQAAPLRLSAARPLRAETRRSADAEAGARPALGRQHGRAQPQPVRRAGVAAGGVPSRLRAAPPRRRAGARRRARLEFWRRRRRERAAAGKAGRDRRRRARRRARLHFAAADRRAASRRRGRRRSRRWSPPGAATATRARRRRSSARWRWRSASWASRLTKRRRCGPRATARIFSTASRPQARPPPPQSARSIWSAPAPARPTC